MSLITRRQYPSVKTNPEDGNTLQIDSTQAPSKSQLLSTGIDKLILKLYGKSRDPEYTNNPEKELSWKSHISQLQNIV